MKISVVLSVYNQEEYLDKCISSVVEQEFEDKELLIIDDNSKESCNIKIKNYEKKYNWIRVIENKVNIGIGKCRNIGIMEARGDYILFIDSDDYLANGALNIFAKEIEKSYAEIIFGRISKFNESKNEYVYRGNNKFYSTSKICNVHLEKQLLNELVVCNKLFNRKFLIDNDIKSSDVRYYDQISISYKANLMAPKVSIINNVTYYQRLRPNSDKLKNPALYQKIDERKLFDYNLIYNELLMYIMEKNLTRFKKDLDNKYLDYLIEKGLFYLNIIEDKEDAINSIADNLSNINLKKVSFKGRKLKKLQKIKRREVEGYFDYLKTIEEANKQKKNPEKYKRIKRFSDIYDYFAKKKRENKSVLFIANFKEISSNFEYMNKVIQEHNNKVNKRERVETRFISTKDSKFRKIFFPYWMAKASHIVLSENIPYLTYINKAESTKVIQTWHAAGAFKKFGYSTNYMPGGPNPLKNKKMTIHRNYDYAIVSSEEVRKHYAEAFMMDKENVLPYGLARTDFFFDEEKVAEAKEDVLGQYNQLKNKKVILYAPTFRGAGKKRNNFKMELDFEKLANSINEDYVIALKLHPSVDASKIKIDKEIENKVINLSKYPDINKLMVVSDILITDYSSVIFEYSLLNKPMIFYAYDLDEYLMDRNFYYEYEEFVPGNIVKNMDELILEINRGEFNLNRVSAFKNKFMGQSCGKSSKRIVEKLILDN